MTQDERIADLERRVAQLEHLTLPLMPLGPGTRSYETLQNQQDAAVDRIAKALGERVRDGG